MTRGLAVALMGWICLSLGSVSSEAARGDAGAGTPVSFSRDVLPILVQECGYCHVREDRYGYLALDGETAWPSLVNVPAFELPSMSRVEPGELHRSYLWLKLTGQHLEAGGSGWLMPYFPLEPPMRDTIRRWIEQGARND